MLSTVRIDREPRDGPVFEGQAIAVNLKMSTTFKWNGSDTEETRLVFDIQPNAEDWLVLGSKKGSFSVDVS